MFSMWRCMLLLCFVWQGQYGHWNCGSLPHSTFRCRNMLVWYLYTFLHRGQGNSPGNLYLFPRFLHGCRDCWLGLFSTWSCTKICMLSVVRACKLFTWCCLVKLPMLCSRSRCNTISFEYNWKPLPDVTDEESWTVSCLIPAIFSNSW
jgi:hypothetical protein